MTETMTRWLQMKRHPPFEAILYLYGGILLAQDCGRLTFAHLTTIFDILPHQNITEKVRFERDITALHMQYRPYALQLLQSLPLCPPKSIKSVIPTTATQQIMHQTTFTKDTGAPHMVTEPIPNIKATKTNVFKPQIVSIKLDKSPKKTIYSNANTVALLGASTVKQRARKPLQNIHTAIVNKPTQKKMNLNTPKKKTPWRKTVRGNKASYVTRKPSIHQSISSRIKIQYIWIYKCLILSYLDCKKLRMPEKFVYDSLYKNHGDIGYDDNKYKVEINVEMPSKVTSDGLDNDRLLAEYNAFYNLFLKLVANAHVEGKLMVRLIAAYKFEADHIESNRWWFGKNGRNVSRRDTMAYFYDLADYRFGSDGQKAIYCYNINRDFDAEYEEYRLSNREKQMLWYHAVSYLFQIKDWMRHSEKNLLLFAMSTYFARRELFENVYQFGMEDTVKFMAIRHK